MVDDETPEDILEEPRDLSEVSEDILEESGGDQGEDSGGIQV